MRVFCPECGMPADLSPEEWSCVCGGALEPEEVASFDPAVIIAGETSTWRYARLYGHDWEAPAVQMGAGWTPLLPAELAGREVLVKLEYLAPTGSFKDRGASVMFDVLLHQGVSHVADDSSGNAGASVAAFAARAGMQADIFVPAHASPAKLAQIAVYGATVHAIPGPRANAKAAAIQATEAGAIYASHAYHPGFLLGQQSVAWELWEQLDGRAPDWYVVPVGQGVHLLGVWLGFKRLQRAGLIDQLPKMVAVQPALLAPLCRALVTGLDSVPAYEPHQPSIAEGLAISQPVRGRRLLQAVRESGGTCVTVEETAILAAQRELATCGFYVEPTSAAAVAGLPAVLPLVKHDELIVVPLTGSGLKGAPSISP